MVEFQYGGGGDGVGGGHLAQGGRGRGSWGLQNASLNEDGNEGHAGHRESTGKGPGSPAGHGQGSLLPESPGRGQVRLGSFLALVLPARGRPAEMSPHQLSFAFAFSKGTDLECVCGDQRRPRLTRGETEALVPGTSPRDTAPRLFARDSEVLPWPAPRGNFRGEFVYFKPHPGSRVGFLCDDFVFCI